MEVKDINILMSLIKKYNLKVLLPTQKLAKRNINNEVEIGLETFNEKSEEYNKLKDVYYWTTQKGLRYSLYQLTDKHISNIITMLEEKNPTSSGLSIMKKYLAKKQRGDKFNTILKKL